VTTVLRHSIQRSISERQHPFSEGHPRCRRQPLFVIPYETLFQFLSDQALDGSFGVWKILLSSHRSSIRLRLRQMQLKKESDVFEVIRYLRSECPSLIRHAEDLGLKAGRNRTREIGKVTQMIFGDCVDDIPIDCFIVVNGNISKSNCFF